MALNGERGDKPDTPIPSGPLPADPPKARILVVDDEEDIRSMLGAALGDTGQYHVTLAADGRKALVELRAAPFDLMITDLNMPELDGTRLLEISRSEFPDLPTVVITGFASMEVVIEILRLGAANFITKPFRLTEIRNIVEKTIKQKREREIPQRILPCLVEEELRFEIPPTYEAKSGVVTYLTDKLTGVGICEESEKYFVTVSLDEALTNAVFYGCLEIPSGLRETESGTEVFNGLVKERMADPAYLARRILVEMSLDQDRVEYRISDPGPGFPVPDLSEGVPEPTTVSQLHGRGLLLISCFMDELRFNDRGNSVTLVKRKRPAN
jgi:CheY-like chemotaxis protein